MYKIKRGAILWPGLLTFSAGFSNAEAAAGSALVVSHHTGNLTQLALALQNGSAALLFTWLGLILCFFMGSVLAGILFFNQEAGQSPIFGFFSIIQGGGTLVLALLFPPSWKLALYLFVSLGMGLQNGVLKNYRNVTVRTTHMTGYLTDAGVALGRLFRGEKDESWKVRYFAGHLFLFILGAMAGTAASTFLGNKAVLAAGAIQILCGTVYLTRVR